MTALHDFVVLVVYDAVRRVDGLLWPPAAGQHDLVLTDRVTSALTAGLFKTEFSDQVDQSQNLL